MTDETGERPPSAPEPSAAAAATAPAAATPPEDWESRFKYLLADFENFRRRTARDQERSRARDQAEVLRELLPFIEAFDRARVAVDRLPPSDPVRQGMDLLAREWQGFLDGRGIQPVARPGMRFRAEDHEAVGDAPATAERGDGTIAEVVQQGYLAGGELLRPAKVIVARRPAPAPPATRPTPEASTAPSSASME